MFAQPLFGEGPAPIIVEGAEEVADALDRLGVTADQLHTALAHGAADAATVTTHAAAASFGTRLWDGTLTSLRDQLIPRGWTVKRPGGLETVVNPDNRIQITPSLGTPDTGLRDGFPNWKHDRGESTATAVADNQLSLENLDPDAGSWRVQTWWLLYWLHQCDCEQVIRSELSLPTRENGGRPYWGYRILLGDYPIGTAAGAPIPEPAAEPQMGVLRRRNAG